MMLLEEVPISGAMAVALDTSTASFFDHSFTAKASLTP
jgi:hypothetical protein